MAKTLLVVVCMWWCIGQAGAQPFVLQNGDADQKINLLGYARLADAGHTEYTIEQIVQQPAGLKYKGYGDINPNIGLTTHHYWLTFSIKNNTENTQQYYLETARPITDHADLYLLLPDGGVQVQHSGDNIPFTQRVLQHRSTVFKLVLKSGEEYKAYIHLKSDGEVLDVPLNLYTPDAFLKAAHNEQLVFGLFYGILILAAIIYLFFYAGMKDNTFLYYGVYVLGVGLMQFTLDGFLYKYIMPGSGWLYQRMVILSAMLSTFFFARYVFLFLDIRNRSVILRRFFLVLNSSLALLFVAVLVSETAFAASYPIANFLGLVMLISVIASIATMWVKKIKVDVFFTLGVFFLVAGFVVFILKNFSVLPESYLTKNSTKFGSGLEVIFLSLSMSNRMSRLRSEKEKMQAIALQRSQEMNELKSHFMSNMSHELRTPLNAIMGIADVMVKEAGDAETRNKFEIIKYASVSLLSSVNDILDFSKIEKKEIRLEHEAFSPAKILGQIRNNWVMQAQDKGLDFEYIVDPTLPGNLYGDAMRLGQIANNVLSNAVKFSSQGKIVFMVSYIQTDGEQIELHLDVTDTGIGINEQTLKRIFNSFMQEKIDNKRKFGGLGLGLSIVKELVNLHGGEITIDSEEGKGTTCRVNLPYAVASIQKQVLSPFPTDDFDLLGSKILVVEDNSINQLIIRTILSKWKNTGVKIVNDGSEAIKALKQEHFDIVLMDLQMPVMDGYEATVLIRKGAAGNENSSIPIIAITADVMETTRQKVKTLGMNDYMAKPIDQAMLYEKVINHLSPVNLN